MHPQIIYNNMKFSDGVWRAKEGIEIRSAVEVGKLGTSISPTSVFWHPFKVPSTTTPAASSKDTGAFIRALCHTKVVTNPGGTLGTPTITLNVTSPIEGVVTFDIYHFRGASAHKVVRHELFPDGAPAAPRSIVELDVVQDTLQGATLTSGDIGAKIDTRPASFQATIFNPTTGKTLTSIGQDSLQWIIDTKSRPDALEVEYSVTTGSDPYHRQPDRMRKSFMSVATRLAVGEKVYGLGERFGPFVKNGQVVELTNGDAGTSNHIGQSVVGSRLKMS